MQFKQDKEHFKHITKITWWKYYIYMGDVIFPTFVHCDTPDH